ncbi:MAG: hypothetical protein ACE5D6_08450, partial [Candidatus Zixiibacteriota bacterium]
MKNPQTKSSNQQGFKFINDYNIKMSNKTLTINKSLFIKTIKNLKNEESLPSIRSKICKLIEQLSSYKNDKIGLLNIDSNGDTVQLKEKFIHQELKQIIESKTLDRAI